MKSSIQYCAVSTAKLDAFTPGLDVGNIRNWQVLALQKGGVVGPGGFLACPSDCCSYLCIDHPARIRVSGSDNSSSSQQVIISDRASHVCSTRPSPTFKSKGKSLEVNFPRVANCASNRLFSPVRAVRQDLKNPIGAPDVPSHNAAGSADIYLTMTMAGTSSDIGQNMISLLDAC